MAGLITAALWPGTRIDELAGILSLGHSGAVRTAGRLCARFLAPDVGAANRICRFCDGCPSAPNICPTEHRARAKRERAVGPG